MADIITYLQQQAEAIQKTEGKLDAQRETRDKLMSAARKAGHTWREIAATANLTEFGAQKAVKKYEDQKTAQNGL